MPIDTLKAARRLQEDDTFSPDQAERIAEVLSEMDVASATKDDLDDLEGRLTNRIDRLGERIGEVEKHLGERIDETNGRIDRLSDRIDRLDEKVATEADLKAIKSDVSAMENRLEQKIEEKHSATIRILVGAVAAVGAVLAVVIPLAIYLIG